LTPPDPDLARTHPDRLPDPDDARKKKKKK